MFDCSDDKFLFSVCWKTTKAQLEMRLAHEQHRSLPHIITKTHHNNSINIIEKILANV